ncbi:MAG: ribosome biogenesis GTP-binding protein YihA/YsxC [Pseudomonadota bacterium]
MEPQFVAAFTNFEDLPNSDLVELAIVGRSNCGKSSLINALSGKNKLARTSRTPGRTRQLVFFSLSLDDSPLFHLVDLPGYGFAKISKVQKRAFEKFVPQYIDSRNQLKALLLLNDLRRKPGDEEQSILRWAKDRKLTTLVVLTKADKLSKNRRFAAVESTQKILGLNKRPLVSSIHEKQSIQDLRRAVVDLLWR